MVVFHWYLISLFFIVEGKLPWRYNGTIPGLQAIITGRCYQFLELDAVNRLYGHFVDTNCTVVWEKFKTSFAYKDLCNMTEGDYKDLFQIIDNGKTSDQLMFWSGKIPVVHDFTYVNANYMTLEDTFSGYLANDLHWCGCKDCKDGINYKECNPDCWNKAYWTIASRSFASKANGTAYVMINGTTRGHNTGYQRESTFGGVELPTLGKQQLIKKLVVLVISDLGVQPKEKCGEGSLKTLASDATSYGIPTVDCIDNPRMVHNILCAKYPKAEQCLDSKDCEEWKITSVIHVVLFIVALVMIVILVAVLRRYVVLKKKGEKEKYCPVPNDVTV